MSSTLHGFLGFVPAEASASLLRTRIAATFWPHCSDGRATTAASEIWGLEMGLLASRRYPMKREREKSVQ